MMVVVTIFWMTCLGVVTTNCRERARILNRGKSHIVFKKKKIKKLVYLWPQIFFWYEQEMCFVYIFIIIIIIDLYIVCNFFFSVLPVTILCVI